MDFKPENYPRGFDTRSIKVSKNVSSVKCCATGTAEVNLAQILLRRGTEVLRTNSPMQSQGKQFYSLYSDQRTNLSKTDKFEVPNSQV